MLDQSIASRSLVAFLQPEPAASDSWSDERSCTLRCGPIAAAPAGDEDAAPTVRIDRAIGDLEVTVLLSSVVQLFHHRRGEVLYITTDPRWLRTADLPLDDEAVYCLLQFGALLPPLSMWNAIRRFTPGRRVTIRGDRFSMREEPLPFWTKPRGPASTVRAVPTPAEQEESVRRTLDRALERCAPDRAPLILFSGGVDSGLLAARTAALGWRDTVLVNYRTGAQDPEGDLARAMAAHLGHRFECAMDDPGSWRRFLDTIGSTYAQPQGDYSTLPIFMTVQRALEVRDARKVLLDGSAADGVFGGFPRLPRWERLYKLPLPFRLAGAAAFRLRHCWTESSSSARKLAAMRASCQMPILLSSTSIENALLGVAYTADPAVRKALFDRTRQWVDEQFALPHDTEVDPRTRGLDLMHLVCGMVAQKSASPLLGSQLSGAFPFLEPEIMRLGFEQGVHWPEQRESKAVLKRLLARSVPREMVYRPKSGPKPPITAQLASPAIAEMLREAVLGVKNPLRPYLKLDVVRELVECAARGTPLPNPSYNLLWTLFVTALWFDQIERESKRASSTAR
ncbi:MAG: asparagine synthase C-terminal domain-containing protein [Candidatus Eisenbacteria bacterium]